METQPGLLSLMLRQKDADLADHFDACRARIETALDEGTFTAVHGPDHWRAVEIYCARIIPERVFQQFAAGEVALLAGACIVHDLKAGERTAADAIGADPVRYGLDGPYAAALRAICEAVLNNRRLRSGQRWAYVGRQAADLRRIAAVIHVADRLDCEHTDCPLPEAFADLAPEKARRWPNERGLTVGLIDPREGILRLDMIAHNRAWREQIERHFMPFVNEAMFAARNILLASGMPFREVQLHDLHAKPSADVARAQEIMQARAGARRRPERPFKLLDSYGEDESHLLVARDEDTLRVAGRALTAPITVLLGESGVGKTSLLAAGVLPWLRYNNYNGVLARCLNDPTRSLVNAVAARLGRELPPNTSLPEAARALAEGADTPAVFILDQCQELFTRLGSLTRQEFARDVAELLAMPGDLAHVVLAVQREYFVHLAELLPTLPTIYSEVVELKRLTREQAETVIRRSLGRFRMHFDGLVVSHLLDDLASSSGILPVELQICCDALVSNMEEGERHCGYEIYRRIGPARRILDGLVENRLRAFRWRRHTLARSILVSCVTSERTKALITPEECAVDIGADLATTQELLDELVRLGLLSRIETEEGPLFELRHEYLAKSLEEWISDVEREAKDVDDLLRRELNNYQRFQLLLDKETLRLIHQYRQRLSLTPEKLELVIRSAAQERFEVDYWFQRVNELTVSQQMVLCVDLLYSPEPDLRDALRVMISRLDYKAVMPTLLDSLQEAEPTVRETAIEVLREIDQDLVRALQPGDTARQQQAAYALGQIGARHAVPVLVDAAKSAADEVREQAVEALAEIDRMRSAELLIRSLRSGSRQSRWNAAMALGRLGRDAAVRERLQREAERPEATESVLFAYARAAIEGRQLREGERMLRLLERRAVPDEEAPRIEAAWRELEALRAQEQRGLLAWPMYRGGTGGAGYTPAGLRLPLELKWEFVTGDRVLSSPAVANGVVYIGSTDKHLYALDADSGAERWSYDTGAPIHSAPCVVGDRVFIGCLDGRVHAVETIGGRPAWVQRFGDAIESSIRGDASRLYVGTGDGAVVAFLPQTGRQTWRAELGGRVEASPAIEHGMVAVGAADGALVLLAAEDGARLWEWPVEGGLRGSPALVDGRVVVGSGDGRIDILNTSGELLWTAFMSGPVGSSPAVAHGQVFVGGQEGDVTAFRVETGERLWTFQTDGAITASPTVAGSTVFVGSHSGQLLALRARAGRPEWRYRTGYGIYSTPAVADGRLFVALRYYNVCAFAEPVEVEDGR